MSSPKALPRHISRVPGSSMGYKFEFSLAKKDENPGPGTYRLPEIATSKSVGTKFSVSPRFDFNPTDFSSTRQQSLDFEPIIDELHKATSSDNLRHRKYYKNSSTFGIASRPSGFFKKAEFPLAGPGRYDVKNDAYLGGLSKTHQSSVNNPRTFKYFKTDPDIPGPGSYNVFDLDQSIKLKRGIGFSKSKKDYLDIKSIVKNSPNGSSYYQSSIITNASSPSKGVSFGKQKKDIFDYNNKRPGPGYYDLKDDFASPRIPQAKGTFGSSKKFNDFKYYGGAPGPGDYALQEAGSFYSTKRGVSFTKSLTTHFKHTFSSLPGPGNYELPDEFTKKQEEIRKKIELVKERLEEKHRNDGLKALKPIINEKANRLLKASSTSSSKINVSKEDLDAPREKMYRDTYFEELVEHSQSPGPIYMVEGSIKKDLGKRGTNFSHGKEIERGYIQELVRKKIPGPGAYKSEKIVNKKISVKFAESKRQENVMVSKYQQTVPGVGLYEQKLEKKSVGGSFGKALKPTTVYKTKSLKSMDSKLQVEFDLDNNFDLTLD